MTSVYDNFKKEKIIKLKDELGKSNVHEVPQIEKVVVAIGVGSLYTRKGVKDFSDLEKNLSTITGQKPHLIKSKRAVAGFKLREGMPSMLKVTLRDKRAYDFIDRMVKLVLPRVRDFSGLSDKKFDNHGNYNLGLPSQVVFPEINPDDIVTPKGIQITISSTSDSKDDTKKLLQSLGVIFDK